MKTIPIQEVQEDLAHYLALAETETIVITRQGVPAGILIGLDDADDWWEALLLRDPQFQARVAQARKSLREGKGVTIEQVREHYDLPPPPQPRSPEDSDHVPSKE